jgi:NAD(P)-dependent dehydrogenase (short-subunit alcohol dehydrogenase family)
MTQTALVTGATGLLGREVLRTFQRESGWKAVGQGLTRAAPPDILKADLQNADEIEKLLDDVK